MLVYCNLHLDSLVWLDQRFRKSLQFLLRSRKLGLRMLDIRLQDLTSFAIASVRDRNCDY